MKTGKKTVYVPPVSTQERAEDLRDAIMELLRNSPNNGIESVYFVGGDGTIRATTLDGDIILIRVEI